MQWQSAREGLKGQDGSGLSGKHIDLSIGGDGPLGRSVCGSACSQCDPKRQPRMRSQSHGGPRTRSPKPALCRVRGPGAGDVATTYRPPVRGRRSSGRTQLDSCLSRGGRRSGLRPGQEKGPLWSHNGGLCERGVSIAQRCLLHPTPPPPEAVAPVLIHSQQQNNLPPGYLPLGTSLQNAVAKEGLPLDTAPKVHSCTLCIHEHISTRVC